MQDVQPVPDTLLGDPDEFLIGTVEPGCFHPAIGMPEGAELIPEERIAVHHPSFNEVANDDDSLCFSSMKPNLISL